MELLVLLLIILLLGGGGLYLGGNLLLIILLIVLFSGGWYVWPRGNPATPAPNYGYYPVGGIGLVLIVVAVLALTHHI